MSEEINQPEVQNLEKLSSELELYSKEVIGEMIRQNIPPTPSNFDAYFDKMLESKPVDFKNDIIKILELEHNRESEQQILMEQHLKEAFLNVKKFMQPIKLIYKNLNYLVAFIEKRRSELKVAENKTDIMVLLDALENNIKSMNEIIKKKSKPIKKTYQVTSELVYEVQELAVYDSRFEVYKKKYFMHKLKNEVKLIEEFHHESSIMMIKVNEKIFGNIKNPKVKYLTLRAVSRLLLKISRRSDLIAIYDDGIFSILMRHTSVQNAQKAAKRIKDVICGTNFFIGKQEMTLDVNIGIARIDLERPIETTLICAIDAIALGEKENLPYGVCPEDIEQSQITD